MLSQSKTKIWLHAIITVKDIEPLILMDHSLLIHRKISECFEKQGCSVEIVNGFEDHVHVLFLAPHDKSISAIIADVQQESADWISRQVFMPTRLDWQDEFMAFSVSESQLDEVEQFIKDQVVYHHLRTTGDEVGLFMDKFGLENR